MPISKDYLVPPSEHLIGVIADLRDETGDFGPRIVLEFVPLGEENPRFQRYNAETARSRRSGWQRMLAGLRKLGVDTSEANNIIGLIVDYQLVENTFTTEEGEERTYDVWKPVKVYENEAAALVDLAAIVESQPESTPATSTIPKEVLESAKVVWSALNDESAFRAITWPENVDVDALVKAVS